MKRIALIHVVLVAVLMAVLVSGCSSTDGTSKAVLQSAGDEVVLAGYQAGSVAGAVDSLGMEVTLPLWFISGK